MHFGLETLVPLALYVSAIAALLLSVFWRPYVGLFFLIPLLPLQTLRYKLQEFPLGNKLVDVLLLGVFIGALLKGHFHFARTPLNRWLLVFAVFCYVQLWRGAFFLNSALPLSPDDPRFSNWKNYMVLFVLFALVAAVMKDIKQIKIVILLIFLAVLAVDKGYYSSMSGRDLSHFSYDVRDGGPLGYAGVNGVGSFEAELMLFLLGMNAFQKRKAFKAATWLLLLLSGYCLMFSYSREAYAGILVGLFVLGLLKQRWMLLAVAFFLLSWQTLVPVAVKERVLMTYEKNEGLDSSAQDRVAIWDDAMELFRSDPILGGGFDTYQWQQRVGHYRDTHNYFLKVLVETGLAGLAFFLFILVKAAQAGLRLYRSAEDPFLKSLAFGFLLMLVGLLVVNCFGDRWLYLQVNGFFWVILACVVRGQMIVDEQSVIEKAGAVSNAQTPAREPVFA